GIALASPGATVNVAPGTYPENVVDNKWVYLLGNQHGVPACGRVVGAPNPASESIITGATPGVRLLQLSTGAAKGSIDGFTFLGSNRQIESISGPLDQLLIANNHFTGFTGNAVFLNDPGFDVTLNANNVDVSINRTPLIDGNVLENHTTNVGANLGSRAFTGGVISNNKIRNNAFD